MLPCFWTGLFVLHINTICTHSFPSLKHTHIQSCHCYRRWKYTGGSNLIMRAPKCGNKRHRLKWWDVLLHKESINPAAGPASALPESCKIISSGLLRGIFLTKLSESDSMRVAWGPAILQCDLCSQPSTMQLDSQHTRTDTSATDGPLAS